MESASSITVPLRTNAHAGALGPGDHSRTLVMGGLTRSYLIHVPPSYQTAKQFPVVLAYHGGASNAEQMVRFCGLNGKADSTSFVAVYPNGTGQKEKLLSWNGGNCCGYAMHNKIDDVAFTRAMLDDLATVLNVDPKRIFATGMSNGAIMAYRLASELADRIAAIAPVAGPMGTETCTPRRAVPVIHFHGTDDLFAPFQGGVGPRSVSRTDFYSVDYSIRAWVKANGCKPEPAIVDWPDKRGDGTTVTRHIYGSGTNGAEVVLFTVQNGGHTWPGIEPGLTVLGKSTMNISANDLMWEFFERHSLT